MADQIPRPDWRCLKCDFVGEPEHLCGMGACVDLCPICCGQMIAPPSIGLAQRFYRWAHDDCRDAHSRPHRRQRRALRRPPAVAETVERCVTHLTTAAEKLRQDAKTRQPDEMQRMMYAAAWVEGLAGEIGGLK